MEKRRPGRRPAAGPTPKENEWRRQLARWRRSGLDGRTWCRRHGIDENLFYHWVREIRLRDERRPPSPAARFLPLKLSTPVVAGTFEVVLARGRIVRVPAEFDAAALARLLAVLEA